MLIDTYCPVYLISKTYTKEVNAPIDKVYSVARALDAFRSRICKWLFGLRGFPSHMTTLDGLRRFGFVMLGDVPPKELAFGLVGKFWTYSGNIQRLSAESFNDFQQDGFAKAVGNIALKPLGARKTLVETETRVVCFGNQSAFCFRLYWTLISPFSGLIRKEWLKIIKIEAEKTA
jgi:hypothetical protein